MKNKYELNRSRFLQLLTLGVLAYTLPTCTSNVETAPRKPNIIYINIDDLGWTDLGFQGSPFYETPNIDKLASQGMVFTDAYAPAANCAPSRACCMTGQYGPRHGVYTVLSSARGKSEDRKLIPTKNTLFIEEDNLTIAHALKAAGYRTCTAGKWHISKDPNTNGFDVNIGGSEWGHPHGGYFSPYKNPKLKDGPKGEYLTDRLTTEVISFIKGNQHGPFFLYLPYYTVHGPIQAKLATIEKYKNKKNDSEAHNSAAYAAMIENLDENIGRLMAALDDMELSSNTLVLFTSDNGGVYQWTKQWPLRAGKGSYYDGGIREPLIVRWPGNVKSGSKCTVPVSGIDYFPTFLEATGAAKPEGKQLDGVSLVPLLTGNKIEERPLFWHFPIYLQGGNSESRDPKFRTCPGSVVRYGDWKLHEYFEDGGLELYNLKEDIGEKSNLAGKNPNKVNELHDMLITWRTETRAPVPSELNPDYKP